ncbi:helix-turn-helix domain-containing protein [Avibacterium paragallinarum]|uniref:Transcriptional regulator n=3 Tax=Avibacterium paragallinarum TaxID=728 RepID=A0A377I6N4_AVIPA|nr:helix-turn-helix transcriptional regulator [Avibacterium paragallinarum]POY45140.1 XRE family transcriptional regulator [Avibacterium paragallinarum]RZN74500.1 XRE family transcriptional regulator [Avibacterium paragallinarum]STO70946.1 transcriptional regulator [Avibacterium paragallinarum]
MRVEYKKVDGFSSRLENARKRLNLSRAKVCEMLEGTAISTLQAWESGIREPPISVLMRLADILQTTPNYLLTGDESANKGNKQTSVQPLNIEEALQALQQAIARQKPKDNLVLDGVPLKLEEMTVIRNYRQTDERGREAILSLSFTMLGFAASNASDDDKDENIAIAANGS